MMILHGLSSVTRHLKIGGDRHYGEKKWKEAVRGMLTITREGLVGKKIRRKRMGREEEGEWGNERCGGLLRWHGGCYYLKGGVQRKLR